MPANKLGFVSRREVCARLAAGGLSAGTLLRAGIGGLFGFGTSVRARPAAAEPLTDDAVLERVMPALDRALEYLSSQQDPEAGTWGNNRAIEALAILSFLGRGHIPGRGPYRDVLDRTRRALLRCQREDGFFASPESSHGPMYEHALITLALAEMYGMAPEAEFGRRLQNALNVIFRSQAPGGGWRYQPRPEGEDLSVTVMQVVALRAAGNANLSLPATTLENAVKYVKVCEDQKNGGFGYVQGRERSPAMTAAGVLCLQLLGRYNDPSLPRAIEYLDEISVEWERSKHEYFYYFHYYAIQAHYHAGGESWNRWHPKVREMFLERQNADGSWNCPESSQEAKNHACSPDNRAYYTAMASLVLEIYLHFLPAYQR